MPELPEIHTIRNELLPVLTGRDILRVSIRDQKLRIGAADTVPTPIRLTTISQFGKELRFHLADGHGFLRVHLRMSGRLLWNENRTQWERLFLHRARGKVASNPEKYIRALFSFEHGELAFLDPRRFGTIVYSHSLPFSEALDPLGDNFVIERFAQVVGSSPQKVKRLILDQNKIVGIGNIYAAEILFRARIHPDRSGQSLSKRELRLLYSATKDILEDAIKSAGTTFSDYQTAHGEDGNFQTLLSVYAREKEKCRRCKGTVHRQKDSGRSTFFCPGCQT